MMRMSLVSSFEYNVKKNFGVICKMRLICSEINMSDNFDLTFLVRNI